MIYRLNYFKYFPPNGSIFRGGYFYLQRKFIAYFKSYRIVNHVKHLIQCSHWIGVEFLFSYSHSLSFFLPLKTREA